MSFTLKQEIEIWVAALAAYDLNEFDSALHCFAQIADTSKILFNIGVINATLGEHAQAVESYQRAVGLDQYFAVAYFQQGVSNFLMGDFEEALANFNDTLLYLRGNKHIDYAQLGLKFQLYSCEVLFNRGLCYIYLQQKEAGMQDMMFAAGEKQVPDHDVIDEAIKEQAEGYTVFSIPVGVVYRPNEAKVKNLKRQDYLGRARLVAEQNQQRTDPRRLAALAALSLDDRPGEKLSYGAVNLVRPDLRSRTRQQSEPPLNRNIFPPTPPPEPERYDPTQVAARRRSSGISGVSAVSTSQPRPATKPPRLELGAAAFDQRAHLQSEKPRIGTKRSESERPAIRRELSNGSTQPRRREERHSYRELPDIHVEADPLEAYSADVSAARQQQQQQHSSHARTRSSVQSSIPVTTISEESEDDFSEGGLHDSHSFAPLAFEIVAPHSHSHSHHTAPPTSASSTSTGAAAYRPRTRRPPEIRKIRIKLHAEDMRYVMTSATATFAELVEQIRVKLGLPVPVAPGPAGGFKLKIKDEEGDLVMMGDQDDWEMAVGLCRAAAARDKAEMGKLEVWVQEV